MHILLPEIKELLQERDVDSLKLLLNELLPIDIVELLDSLPKDSKLLIFNLLELKERCNVIAHMPAQDAVSFLELLPEPKVIEILNEMPPDERADLFATFAKEKARRFLSLMRADEAKDVETLTAYHPESAGGIMTTQFAWVPVGITAAQAIEFLRHIKEDFDFSQVYVLSDKKPLGIVSLRRLIVSPPNTAVKKIMRKVPTVPITMDQEKVAHLITKYHLPSIPVVNEKKEIQGIITVDDIVDVIKDEVTEDIHKFGATTPLRRKYFDVSAFGMVKSRLPWLVILLFASFISGFVIESFSEILRTMISLTFFMPVLLNCSGNAGMQSASIVIRGLATGEIRFEKIWNVITKELLIGILLGIGLGILIALRSLPVERSFTFGLTVGLSMSAGIIIATIIGTVLPIIFGKMGFDPALMSGPLLTTIMDSTSLLIYFGIAISLCHL